MKKMSVRSILVLCGLAIVLLLLLFLVPLTGAIRSGNTDSQAENTVYNLRNAISAYFIEYRTFPISAGFGDTTVNSGHELMDILLGSEKEAEEGGANRRKIVFFTGKVARSGGKGRFRKGVALDKDGRGELRDPWGNYYRVRYDTDRDNHVEDPGLPGRLLLGSIFVWSAGKDGDFETWEDNVRTW